MAEKLDLDLTELTLSPDWPRLAKLLELLEKESVDKLKSGVDPNANVFLMALARVKAEIRSRTRNPQPWKV